MAKTLFTKTFLFLVILVVLSYYIFSTTVTVIVDPLPEKTMPTIIPLRNSTRVQNSEEADMRFIFSYKDLDVHLCKEEIPWPDKIAYQRKVSKSPCPKKGIASAVFMKGRTANQMWEYASIWAVAKRTGLEPYVPRCTKSTLDKIFDNLSLPGFEKISHCPIVLNTFVKSIEEWTSMEQSVILPRYTLQPPLVLDFVDDIRKEFRFNQKLQDKAQSTLINIVKKREKKTYTFIGVHVRRTDYEKYLKRKYDEGLVDAQFFRNAMNYFESQYHDCIFVYVSDDPEWCYNQFGKKPNVFVASYKTDNSPAEDLAIMAACNHTIFDYGTFGEWGSILAGGETVYYNMTQNTKKGTGRAMKSWIMMN